MTTRIEFATIEEAWSYFEIEAFAHIRAYAREGESRIDEARAVDEAIAKFVRAHPGEFERGLLSAIPRMAAAQQADSEEHSDLALLIRYGVHGPLGATFAALDPVAGLQICASAAWHYRDAVGPGSEDECAMFALQFAKRIDRDRIAERDLTPEMRDALGPLPLPDVLPADLDEYSPRDIEALLEIYIGAPIEALEARLRPGGSSSTGFLAPDDRLGQIIWEDARTLRSLGVSRHALVDRIERAIKRQRILNMRASDNLFVYDRPYPGVSYEWFLSSREKKRKEYEAQLAHVTPEEERGLALEVEHYGSCGLQHDPFHTAPVHTTSRGFRITNLALPGSPVLHGGWLAMPLIRRLCFFEGHVPYRIEPEVAARVLGLVR